MAIPAQFIDELMARCDIADVVADYVPLTRKGGSLWGCCPFHSERTPSFHVVPERQMYKCFGCGKGGGVINFIMEMENLSYPDAVRFLAKRAGLTVPEERGDGSFRKKRERLLALNKEAARYFHSVLRSPAGQPGMEYLFGKRRLSKATVTRFGLGMAPEGWDKLITAMAAKGYEKGELLEAGLVVRSKEGRVYDRFRNRVMFPIIDLRGDVIGFGGRVLDDSTPKYLNSPDTPVFNKGRNLFALNIAKKTRLGRIILTEGYMDTLSLHQAGFDCAVASLGTALTADHAQLLARYTKEVVIAYDGDGAGVSAAQRAIGLLEKTGMKVRVLRMKGAKDPDEFIGKYGPEAFAKLLDQSENHIEYRIDQVKGKYDLTDDAQRVEFLKEAVPILAQLPSPAEREGQKAAGAEGPDPSGPAPAQGAGPPLRQHPLRRCGGGSAATGDPGPGALRQRRPSGAGTLFLALAGKGVWPAEGTVDRRALRQPGRLGRRAGARRNEPSERCAHKTRISPEWRARHEGLHRDHRDRSGKTQAGGGI